MRRVKTVAENNPPMITTANGFCDSDPIPVETAAGNNPIAAMSAVMITGRVLTLTASLID